MNGVRKGEKITKRRVPKLVRSFPAPRNDFIYERASTKTNEGVMIRLTGRGCIRVQRMLKHTYPSLSLEWELVER